MVQITPLKPGPNCLKAAKLTDWRAPVGYDKAMRQYSCPDCGYKFYVIGGPKTFATISMEEPES